jgi:hypothetical protein
MSRRLRGDGEVRLKRWREKDGKAQPSLTWAINNAVKWWFWSGGVLEVISNTALVTSPLILKVGWLLWFMLRFSCDILHSSFSASSNSQPILTLLIDRIFQPRASEKELALLSPS